ncbi:MAG: DUF5829 family protein [Sphingomonas paucimobilis]
MRALLAAALLAAAPGAAARPGLNHVYVVLDQATFDAIRSDPRVAQLLGPNDGGLPDYAPPRADADRIFLRGRTTYLELFAPKNRFDEPVGKVGIALAEDRARDFERLAKRWQGYCPYSYSRASVAWTRSQPPIPWYDSVQCAETAMRDDLSIWAMVYRPAFGRWQLGSPVTARRAILEPRTRAGQGRFDVTALELAVPRSLRTRVEQQLIAAGLTSARRGDTSVLTGRGWTITLRPTSNPAAVLTAIGMRVLSDQSSTLTVGSGRLSSGRLEATLRFHPASTPPR